MFNDELQDDVTLETTSDGDETTDETSTEVEAEQATDYDWKADALKNRAINERLRKKIEGGDEKKPEPQNIATSDDAQLARLEARGIMDSDAQNYLLSAAKREGKSPVELLNDPYFKDRIDAMTKDKERRGATPSPSNRTPETKKDVSFWVKQVQEGKPSSPDPAMRKQVREVILKSLPD